MGKHTRIYNGNKNKKTSKLYNKISRKKGRNNTKISTKRRIANKIYRGGAIDTRAPLQTSQSQGTELFTTKYDKILETTKSIYEIISKPILNGRDVAFIDETNRLMELVKDFVRIEYHGLLGYTMYKDTKTGALYEILVDPDVSIENKKCCIVDEILYGSEYDESDVSYELRRFINIPVFPFKVDKPDTRVLMDFSRARGQASSVTFYPDTKINTDIITSELARKIYDVSEASNDVREKLIKYHKTTHLSESAAKKNSDSIEKQYEKYIQKHLDLMGNTEYKKLITKGIIKPNDNVIYKTYKLKVFSQLQKRIETEARVIHVAPPTENQLQEIVNPEYNTDSSTPIIRLVETLSGYYIAIFISFINHNMRQPSTELRIIPICNSHLIKYYGEELAVIITMRSILAALDSINIRYKHRLKKDGHNICICINDRDRFSKYIGSVKGQKYLKEKEFQDINRNPRLSPFNYAIFTVREGGKKRFVHWAYDRSVVPQPVKTNTGDKISPRPKGIVQGKASKKMIPDVTISPRPKGGVPGKATERPPAWR